MQSLEVKDLRISLGGHEIVRGVTFSVEHGQRVCLLGESGSGKSLTASAILGHLPMNARVEGMIRINGVDVTGIPAPKRPQEARVSMVFQDSSVALNPLVRIQDQLVEPLRRHRKLSRHDAHSAALELLESVGLPNPQALLRSYSAQLSGGQRQRVCIALALACTTGLMVADEPTTALDVVTQAKVLAVLEKYTAGENTPALLFITHDFAVASELCSDAVVMKGGLAIEQGPLSTLFSDPKNAYTKMLIDSAALATIEPHLDREAGTLKNQDLVHEDLGGTFFELRDVSKQYAGPSTGLFKPRETKIALHPVNLRIFAGQRVGVVGGSGSGKTTLLRLILALEASDTGQVTCEGKPIFPASVHALKWYRRKVQYVPQDPASTLDPLMTVRSLVMEPLERLDVEGDHPLAVAEALESVGLDESFLNRRANELSGGQAQRVALARALATKPHFLLADEPVSGLDLPMRATIIKLLTEISESSGAGIIVVSHDLSMVAAMCTRTIVMHDGHVIEDRDTYSVLTDPQHVQTRSLIASIPSMEPAA